MMHRIILIVAIALFPLSVSSQTLNDPLYVNYSLLPKTGFDSNNGDVTTNMFEVSATLPPLNIGKKVKILNGVYYRNSNFEYTNSFPQNKSFPQILHDIRYAAIFRAQINDKWEFVALPRLIIRSDLRQTVNANDFFPQVNLLVTYAINGNPNFKIGSGGAFNNDFERNAIVPLGSLYFNGKKVKIEIIYPNAQFLYKQSESFEFGLFTSLEGTISRISPFTLEDENATYFRTLQLLVAPTISHRLYKNIFGHLKIGFASIRNFEVLNTDFKAIQNQDFDLNLNLFLRTGISFRLKN